MRTTSTVKEPTTGLDEIWTQIREHHGDLAGLKRDVGALGETVSRLGTKLDEVLSAVTSHAARQGPSLMQILGAALTLCGIVAALATGISVYVGSIYDGRIVTIQNQATSAQAALAQRDAEDRAELSRLRADERFTWGERLRKLEEHTGWAPKEITRPSPLPPTR